MLQSFFVRNVALIERLGLDFKEGFNVLTGETGAGKSIIIDAVNLVLGERANRELIKSGAEKASVEAVFDVPDNLELVKLLDEAGIETDGQLILSRELSISGKNICRINGTLTTLASLKRVGDLLVDLHGQHEHQALLSPATHIGYLDASAQIEIAPVKAELEQEFDSYRRVRGELLSGFSSEEEREREMDMLSYQITEIDAAKLDRGEEEKLLAERLLLVNAEKILSALEIAYEAVAGDEAGAIPLLDGARRSVQGIAGYSAEYEELSGKLSDAYYSVEDIGHTLRDIRGGLDYDPARLDEVELRLDLIAALKRKYGAGIDEILSFRDAADEKLQALRCADERRIKIEAELQKITEAYVKTAARLTELRKQAAAKLSKDVLGELSELGLAKASFEVHFFEQENAFTKNGTDKVEFLLSANAGEPLKPLAKVASGGEMSRIMLAFKTIFAENDRMPTLIFDEIDSGISGKAAATVGEKMVRIADSHQVLCITHLPQIAALADVHFLVEKHDDGASTHTEVHELGYEERCAQIGAMMGGSSETAYNHAKELIDTCEGEKRKRRKIPAD